MIEIFWPLALVAIAFIAWDAFRRHLRATKVDKEVAEMIADRTARLEALERDVQRNGATVVSTLTHVDHLRESWQALEAIAEKVERFEKRTAQIVDAHNESAEEFTKLAKEVLRLKNIEAGRQIAKKQRASGR